MIIKSLRISNGDLKAKFFALKLVTILNLPSPL
jgi:hypothetical protein